MIKCHICQVLNEDNARFCLECGQRFVKATNNNLPAFPVANTSVNPNNLTENSNQPKSLWSQEDFENDDSLKNQKIDFTKESTYNENLNKSDQHFHAKDNMNNFNNPNDDNLTNPKSSKLKLHSPLLGNDDDDDYQNASNNKTNFSGKQKLHSPLLGNDDDNDDYQNASNNKTNFSGKQKLHSPLLGNDDDDDYPNKSNNKTNISGKQKLHSPLLGNDDDDYQNASNNKTNISGKQKLHSPLLGNDDDDYQNASNNKTNFSGKQKLHSPLLGNDDDDYQNASNNKTNFSGKQKLHSPLLGNDDDDYQNASNNKTNFSGKQKLHSPLLGNDANDDYQNASNNKTNFSGKQKLHSPLLGNDDNDDYAYSGQRNNSNNKSKLNSPLLRNNKAENDYEDEPVFEEINDPNVFRSPLLLSKIHTNETKQTSTNLNKANPQNNIDSGRIQSPKPQIDNYNAGQLNPEIINSSKPENTVTSDQIATNLAQPKPQITRPGFSEPEYNTKLIKPDSSPKTNLNLPLSSVSGKTSQTLPSANLSQIANEVEAEIDNSKNYRSRTTKPPKIDNYPDKSTNQSLKINRTLFVMIFIALLAKLGYIILTFIQQPASLNTLFIINEFAQLLLFSSCLMTINTLSK